MPAMVSSSESAPPAPARTPLPYENILLAGAALESSLKRRRHGFTLIELSIVLVVIGLVVGGVLVGQNLIAAAEVRAQITQIEKYNSAVNTFRSKFNAIPGDMRPEVAQQFGFAVGSSCAGLQGNRDGNGLIDGWQAPWLLTQGVGETALFWQDLTSPTLGVSLIEGQFPNSGGAAIGCIANVEPTLSGTTVGEDFPVAKIGRGDFVYVYETSGSNWYGVAAITTLIGSSSAIQANTNISVMQAYNIDKKLDDGSPTTGNVVAVYVNNSTSATSIAPNTTTSGGTSSSCYDTTTSTYSITVNNGNGGNCALSFKFQ